MSVSLCFLFFFFKQKTAYEVRISDWSSDVCSSDLADAACALDAAGHNRLDDRTHIFLGDRALILVIARRAAAIGDRLVLQIAQIGRASCRESVCQYV